MSRILGNTLSAKCSEKKILQKCDDHCVIPVTLKVSNPPENIVDSYFIAGFVLSRN